MCKKTIVITGASSGIGKATAKYFAERGWNVAATMRQPERERELDEIESINLYELDVTVNESIEKAYESIYSDYGKVDVLLNNAGCGLVGPFELMSDEQIRRQFEVNVFGIFNVTRAFLPHFRENREGMIINISSMAGKVTVPLTSLYNACKFAVEGFSEALSYEMNQFGIKVKLVEPGRIATDFRGRSLDLACLKHTDEYQAYVDNCVGVDRNSRGNGIEPLEAAKVIFEAVNDDKNQFRYVVGDDAKQFINFKEKNSDEEYMKLIESRYSL